MHRSVEPSLPHHEGARAGNEVTPIVSVLIFCGVTLAVTVLVVLTGGAPTTLGHLYYIPILYIAVRHGARAAALAAVVAGLAAGPWMPSSVAGEEYQALGSWLVRLVLLVLVGVVTALLARSDSRPLDVLVRDIYIARGLRNAVRQDQIRVHYQPLIKLADGQVVGVEALCCWNDSKQRPVPPALFIPAAERSGVVVALGRRVLRLAVDQAQEWAADGRDGLLVTVNVSAVQLSDPSFMADLARATRGHATDAFRLCLEITETAIIADPVRALTTLRAARGLGITIALDDFGTGQSSLAYLADFPIDIIKIDQSFVAAIGRDPKGHALVRAMVQMAHSLGALTIAEGIETAEQLKALRELGCTLGQGYYLGRPGEADAVVWQARDTLPATDQASARAI
ncbi:MAG TPA: EAL domain-containing protein [Demequina sp.]|nr:EAL domain-containing protein [Demequina sp.]